MTFGVIGCGPGIGVTHLSIALSVFCHSKLKQKAAFLELHSRNEIVEILSPEARDSWRQNSTDNSAFFYHGVDYYPCISHDAVPALMNQGYDYLFFDMGNICEADLTEFLRCDRKLVLGSLAPWKSEKFEHFFQTFENNINLGEGFYYLVQTGTPKTISDFSRVHHINLHQIPFIKNPFRIEKELFLFLQELLL